ncbi:MAG: nucleoside kinase [Lachnospiraceae bacterium]|nr:nucleoside kinase [Lachnospiraceae bacterium]
MKVTVFGKECTVPDNIRLQELASSQPEGKYPYVLAKVNGKLQELFHTACGGDEIEFLDVTDAAGFDAMRRSASMLFLAAAHDVLQERADEIVQHFTIGSGFYFTFGSGCGALTPEVLRAIEERMHAMCEQGIPFVKRSVPTRIARLLFSKRGMPDKEKLFRTRISSSVNIYSLGDYQDYYYGYMVPDTSVLGLFELLPERDGVILNLPRRKQPDVLPEFQSSVKLMDAQLLGEAFSERQGIGTVADLNEMIIRGETAQTILVSEALQESLIAEIARKIAEKESIRFVMIAGPSSSGKTTFSQRLCIQLTAHGLRPHGIGVDNYFRNRADMVPGPDGKLDFESLAAVDVEAFNRDMTALLDGETVDMPTFDFIEGKRVYKGEKLTLGKGDILVIEGIHCLNDDLSSLIPAESKFRVYISALTQLNIDAHNRIPSADGRLIRRIIRDYRTRGYSAAQTIAMWDSVREGEEKYIFPYQETADVFFNSALPYEIAALKTYIQPLLFQVGEEDSSYLEARRLLKFLDYFIAVPSEGVPTNSILREFIGGGCFHM